MINIKKLLLLMPLILSFNGYANLITVASDVADNYGNSWQGNGGFGFEPWYFISDAANGASGSFLATNASNPDLDSAISSPNNKAWGSYANGDGFNQFEAYRGFNGNALQQQGDTISITLEHGYINNGGSAGFVLRNQNIHNNIGDYNQAMRFEFGFIGGGQNYSIFDGYGVTDTGIAFTDSGLTLTLSLLSVDLYQLDIYSAVDNSLLQTRNGLLSGTGAIESIALYNRDTELANVYFNNLTINQRITTVPEPSTIILLVSALLLLNRLKVAKISK